MCGGVGWYRGWGRGWCGIWGEVNQGLAVLLNVHKGIVQYKE